jgi:hypothetical protein
MFLMSITGAIFSSPILKVFFYYITTIIKKQLNARNYIVTILLQKGRFTAAAFAFLFDSIN